MRILVSAASKHGATAEIAAAIGDVLGGAGHEVVVSDPDDVVDVASFDALVLGSAVYAGRWQKSARRLVERVQADIGTRPVWLFSSGPIGNPPLPTTEAVDVESISTATRARDHRIFAGRLELSKLTFSERAIIAALRAEFGDFRDWGEIERWATGIGASLHSGAPAAGGDPSA